MINDGDKIIREQIGSIEAGNEHVVFDKEAAWDKLSGRMGVKEKSVYPFPFRWAAAAAVLLLTATSIALLSKKEPHSVAVKKTIARPAEEQGQIAVMPAPQQQKEPLPSKVAHKQRMKEVVNEQEPVAPAPVPETIPATNTLAEVVKPEVATTPRMKVVHINELMDDEEREREEWRENNSHYASGRNSFSIIKPATDAGLVDNPTPTPGFRFRFTQN